MHIATHSVCALNKQAAFSLIELITVMAIIGVLAGIMIPLTGVVRERGREVSCQNNMRQWGQALGMYFDEHRGVFPSDVSSTSESASGAWYNALPRYLEIPSFATLQALGRAPCAGTGKSLYICPSHTIEPALVDAYHANTQSGFHLSYGMNTWINATKSTSWLSTRMRQSQVRYAAQFVVFAEQGAPSRPNVTMEGGSSGSVAFRHRGRACIVFADGHVEGLQEREVRQQQWDPHFKPGGDEPDVPGA